MPIGEYPDFDSCVRDQLRRHEGEKGFSIESARRICGFIEKKTKESRSFNNVEVIEYDEANNVRRQETEESK